MFSHRKFIFVLVIAVVLVSALTVSADTEVKGNLEVISDLTAEIAREVLASFPPYVLEQGVYLKPRGDDEKYQIIGDVFTSVLTANGVKVFTASKPLTGNGSDSTSAVAPMSRYRLDIRALDFNIQYSKIYRSHLIGGKRVKRTARVKLSSTLSKTADGSVVWVKEAVRDYDDQFPFRMLPRVESDLLTCTKPERNATKWSRMVEPVVVSGIIVGLIYLFFSNQSSN